MDLMDLQQPFLCAVVVCWFEVQFSCFSTACVYCSTSKSSSNIYSTLNAITQNEKH